MRKRKRKLNLLRPMGLSMFLQGIEAPRTAPSHHTLLSFVLDDGGEGEQSVSIMLNGEESELRFVKINKFKVSIP